MIESGDYYVVCAVRDVDKMKKIATEEKFDESSYSILELDLASFESTKKFVKTLQSSKTRGIDSLVCNAAVYQPALLTVHAAINRTIMPYLNIFFICLIAQIYGRWLRGAAANQPLESLPLVLTFNAGNVQS